MACWVRMAQEVLNAEFPNFSVLASFSLFSLSEGNLKGRHLQLGGDPNSLSVAIQRLSQFFDVPEDALRAEYADMYVYALSTKKASPNMTNQEAWRVATQRQRDRGHDLAALLPPLRSWIAWSCSTSAIEQNFSQLERVHGNRNSNLSDARLSDVIPVVVTEGGRYGGREGCLPYAQHAQDLYVKMFGCARNHSQARPRLSRPSMAVRGGPGADADGSYATETAFLAERSAQIKRRLEDWTKAGGQQDMQQRTLLKSSRCWTAAMDKEVEFQKAKRLRRMVHSVDEAQILEGELPANFAAVRDAQEAREAQTRARQLATQRRRHRIICPVPSVAVGGGQWQSLRGRRAFQGPGQPPAWAPHTRKAGLVLTRNRCCASCFVVDDVTAPGQRNQWQLALCGGCALTPNFLASRGRQGLVLTFNGAVKTGSRRVWCSVKFVSRHPQLHHILTSALAINGSRWQSLEGTIDDFAQAWRRRGRQTNNAVIALVTPADKAEHEAG